MITEQELIKKLKALRNTLEGGYPDAQEKERVFAVLMAQIRSQSQDLHAERKGFFATFKLVMNGVPYFISSRFAYGMALFLLFAGVASAAVGSRNALPGETLYPAKLAVDEVKVRFTSNPADRAQVQMEIAGHRLREIQEISQTGDEYNGRLNEALSRFAKDVGDAQKNLAQAGDPAQVKAATTQIAKKAQKYSQELTATQALLEQKAAIAQQQADLLAQEQGQGDLQISEPIEKTETTASKKSARSVEFSAFAQARQALEAVSGEKQEEAEAVAEVISEDKDNEAEAESNKEGQLLENGEVELGL